MSVAQSSKKVVIKFTYKGNPLCYWDVTLKHGDVEIAKAKTNNNGEADFGNVRLLSNSVDAYGYKKTGNGDKKWDVKGYIVVAESGTTNFDFEGLVQEMGMGSMLEAAWGLTLNDCMQGSGGGSGGGTVSSGSSTSTSEEEKEEMSEFDKKMEENRAKQQAEKEQREADWESGKTQAEAYQNVKVTQENKIASANNKIKLLNEQLAKKTPGTKEYSDIQYDIRETELERDLSQVKLDKTNRQIAKGNAPLSKGEKEDLVMREDLLSQEADSLKKAKKSGALYGTASTESMQPKTDTPKSEEVKKEEKVKEEEKAKTEEDADALKVYSNEELAAMSVLNLKKLKLDSNSKITNRKVALKTKKAMMKPEKITQTETEITQLEDQVKRIDLELSKRKEAE
jgi:hypothetical protein